MYILPRGGVQRGCTPSAGSGGDIPLVGGSRGKWAPNRGLGAKPTNFLVNVYCNFIVNLDHSL
jgi:hypothetical protein